MIHYKKATVCLTIIITLFTYATSQNSVRSVISPDVLFQTLALNRDLPTAAKPKYLSPTDIIPSFDKTKLFVVEQTAKQIAVVDIVSKAVLQIIKLPNEVTGVAVSNDDLKLYATCSSELWAEGYVYEIAIASGKVTRTVKTGHSTRAPVLSHDGKTLFACNQFNDNISVIDIASFRVTRTIDVIREPYVAKLTPDDAQLIVANSLPRGKSTDTSRITCEISIVDLNDESKSVHLPLPLGSHSALGMTLSPDGKYAFITHLIGKFNASATQIIQGWIHTNNLAIIDIGKKSIMNDVCLDASGDDGCANPWGVECTEDGKFICVTHAGSNQISVIDLPKLIERANTPTFTVATSLANKFGGLKSDIRNLIPFNGKNPRALAVIGNKIYAAGYFSENIEVYDASLSNKTMTGTIALGPEQVLTDERSGELHFYNGENCQGKWQSCHSCHPFTRPDALNWILAAGGNFQKNAKSMLYSWWTPPMNWAQSRETAALSVYWGIRNELGLVNKDTEVRQIGEFLKRLKPMASPSLVKGRLSEAAKKGREIYYGDKADCKKCHPAPLFTNQKLESAIVNDLDKSSQFDSPTIIESWRTGPWDHIGSTDKYMDLMTNPRHTKTHERITTEELKDLTEYSKSL
jgi:YVTN family beta-propeller protein